MKTQIITLESHDDLISVRDRMSWAKTARILLVWPKGEPVDLRPLDLKVLQRHAHALGAQLGIVTRGDAIRREAEAAGLPVFESSAAAQRQAWPKSQRPHSRRRRPARRNLRELGAQARPTEAPWRSSLPARVLAFSAGVLAVLALAGILLPRASITLHPEALTQELSIPVVAAPSDAAVLSSGNLPVRVEKVVLNGSREMTVDSGRITIPEAAARGVIRFRNLTPAKLDIPAGTIVYVPDEPTLRFKTLNDTLLNAGLDQFVEVQIEALQAGRSGNVEAGKIRAIDGPLGLSAAAENLEPTRGGSDRSVIGPDERDRQLILDQLVEGLMSQAEGVLKDQLEPGTVLVAASGRLSQVMEADYEPPAGQAGTRLHLAARIEYSFQVVSSQDLAHLAEAALDEEIPEGFSPAPGSLIFEQASAPLTDGSGITRWQVHAERRLMRSVDSGSLLGQLRGRSQADALAILARTAKWQQEPQIRMQPSWWPWLPLLPFSISVTLQ